MVKHELWELQSMQAAPLSVKIALTRDRIKEWVKAYGEDGVYISFSGGKDSTVLLDLARELYPSIPAIFVDVPTQYPELREFATSFDNVEVLRPKMGFMQVCEKYGFPLISKEVSECVQGARKYLTSIADELSLDRPTDRPTDRPRQNYRYFYEKVTGTGSYGKRKYQLEWDKLNGLGKYKGKRKAYTPSADKHAIEKASRGGTTGSIADSEELVNLIVRDNGRKGVEGSPYRLARMLGILTQDNKIQENTPDKSKYSAEKWKFFLDAPFEISHMCCSVMKKKPAHDYQHRTGRKGITAMMASESRLRTLQWLSNGCNGFDMKQPISNPMAFWTEQDVLLYIYKNHTPICSVYGDVVKDTEVEGQLDFADLGIFDLGRPTLKTTGCSRTGCMLCGFGCHLEKGESRFEQLHRTHPKMYAMLDVMKNNGVTMREAIEWTNEHGNLDIRL